MKNENYRNDYFTIGIYIYIIYNSIPMFSVVLPQIVRYGVICLILGCQILATLFSEEVHSKPFFTLCGTIIMTILLYLGKWRYLDVNIIGYFASRMYFWIPLVYASYFLLVSQAGIRKIWFLYLGSNIITTITTIWGNIRFPEVSRLLAGAATEGEKILYAKYNIGGYGFVYSCLLMLPFCLYKIKDEQNKKNKTFYMFLVALYVFLFIKTQYSTALLLCALSFFMFFFFDPNRKIESILVVLLLLGLTVALKNFLISTLADICIIIQDQGYNQVADRLQQIVNMFTGEEVTGSTGGRLELYMMSLEAFLKSPIIGNIMRKVSVLGGHSEWLDILGGTGIIGTVIFLRIVKVHFENISIFKGKYAYTICMFSAIIFFVFGAIDTVLSSANVGMTFFLVPFLCFNSMLVQNKMCQKGERMYENS